MNHTRIAAVALAVAGVVSFGEGAWIRAEAAAAQILLERAWRVSVSEQRPVKAWPWARSSPVARLSAPDHDVSLVVVSDTESDSLKLGPGHLATSAPPGTLGNTVIAGHRDTHFRFLEQLRPGDPIILDRPDGLRLSYRVTRTEVFDEGSPLLEPTEPSSLTLVTCYPFGHIGPAPLRYAVRAESGTVRRSFALSK